MKSSFSVRLSLILIMTCTIVITFHYAEAAYNPIKAVGVYVDRTCQLSSTCVSYTDLKYLDNSPRTIGELETKNGITKRVYTPKQNNAEWLRFSGLEFVVVDPPSNIAGRIKLITISTDLKQFIKSDQYSVKEYNNTNMKAQLTVRNYSHSWSVDKGCYQAIITGKDWKVLLPAMIEHLRSDCTQPMPYSNISQDIKPITKHDISTSYKSKFDKWESQIKKDCTKQRNACTDLKQPTRAGLKP